MLALTERQARFVAYFTSDPACIGDAPKAARKAGYAQSSAREQAYQLLAKPHVAAAIHAANAEMLSGDLATMAIGALRQIIEDPEAPQRLRVQAAIAVLDRGGYAPQHGASVRERAVVMELTGKTTAELNAILAETDARLAELRADDEPPAP